MYIIPDEVEDTLYCDYCYKFLSVGPVKVYSNRKIKCGRCSEEDDKGIISQYRWFMEKGLFKCVNRLDGCRQLLGPSQVEGHESSCCSKKYVCPVCPEPNEIPTYLLIKHFNEEHGKYVLRTPSFELVITTPCTKVFLHRMKDNLFFIDCKVTTVDTISLNIIYLGRKKIRFEKIEQTFTIEYEGHSVNADTKKASDFYEWESAKGCLLMKPNVDSVHIDFELFIKENTDFVPLSNYYQLDPKKEVLLPRKISLSPSLHRDSGLRLNKHSTTLVNSRDCEIIPYCFKCTLPVSVSKIYSEVKLNKYQPVCEMCMIYGNDIKSKYKLHETLFGVSSVNPIIYSCIWNSWGCAESHYFENILSHEIRCPHQPLQPCPVPSCDHLSKLFGLEDHFKKMHPIDRITLISTFNSWLVENTQKWYVWSQSAFILVEVSITETQSSKSLSVEMKPYRSKMLVHFPKLLIMFKDYHYRIYNHYLSNESNKLTFRTWWLAIYFRGYFEDDLTSIFE